MLVLVAAGLTEPAHRGALSIEIKRAVGKEGLPIGSGEVDRAHSSVIQERLKITGAWWKHDYAHTMLALRTLRANGNWDQPWQAPKKSYFANM